jgi:hypothetical protein
MKETFRVGHSASGIAEVNDHPRRLPASVHRQFLPLLFLHGAFTILGQIQEYLHQALPVGPHRRQIFLNLPPAGDPGIPQRGLDHDAQFVQQRLNLHSGREAGALPQVHRGNTFERQNQCSKGLKVFIIFESATSGQIFMNQRNGPAYVTDFM